MTTRIAAMLGATGGAGTTRLTVETGALLAATGHDVVVFDAAFQTQGLASYTAQRIETDVTSLLSSETELEMALYDQSGEFPGRLAFCPAWAPFERLARAKTAGAANRFEQQLSAAAISHDVVLVDTPPIGGNQAIAAVNAADRIAVVAPDSRRGRDGLAVTRERLADIGTASDVVIANRSTEKTIDADVYVPEVEMTDPQEWPACIPTAEPFTPAIAELIETTLGLDIEIETPDSGRLSGLLRS